MSEATRPRTVHLGTRAIMGLMAVLFASAAGAETLTVFGPRDFLRTTGKPRQVIENFNVSNPGGDYLLRIYNNGGARGEFSPVQSAVIELNGSTVVGPEAFSGARRIIEKPVALLVEDLLMVKLAGGPGGGVTIEIAGSGTGPLRELFMSPDWSGEWEIRTEYRDARTGRLVAVDEGTGPICPDDRVGLSAYTGSPGRAPEEPQIDADCAGAVQDERLDLSCAFRVAFPGCRFEESLDLALERGEDAFSGSGAWAITGTEGDCQPFLQGISPGETIRLTGLRRSADSSRCTARPESLIEKLSSQPELMVLLPRPIADLSAQGGDRTVELRWTAVPGAAAYKVYRAPGTEPFRLIAVQAAGKGAAFLDRQLTNGRRYRYLLRWLDGRDRESPPSNEVGATPASP